MKTDAFLLPPLRYTQLLIIVLLLKACLCLDRNATKREHTTNEAAKMPTFNASSIIPNSINSTKDMIRFNATALTRTTSRTEQVTKKCQGAKCHNYYIHNMYSFYIEIGGFVMIAVVVIGVAFLVITHIHGRHIVRTHRHVVERVQIWDVLQQRRKHSRENSRWI